MYVCMYVYMYVCMYVCMYVYLSNSINKFTFVQFSAKEKKLKKCKGRKVKVILLLSSNILTT